MGNKFMDIPVTGPAAVDIFADEALGFEVINNTVRITFVIARNAEATPPCSKVFDPVGRLILPAESAQRLSLGLFDFLKGAGLDPSTLAQDGQTAQ